MRFVVHAELGQPAEAIVKTARHLGVDLVCLGTRGHGAVGRVVLGSVALDVARHSPVPVMLVH